MFGFLREALFDTLLDWPLGTFLALMGGLSIVLLAMVVFLIGHPILDRPSSWNTGRAQVEAVYYQPSFTTITVVSTGKSMSAIPIFHPESWSAALVIKDDKGIPMQAQATYGQPVQVGDRFSVQWGIGRLSHNVIVK